VDLYIDQWGNATGILKVKIKYPTELKDNYTFLPSTGCFLFVGIVLTLKNQVIWNMPMV
jgi:hypothetical protein